MYSFKNDYSEGAHPQILEALNKTNFEQEEGYGEDTYCKQAIEVLKEMIGQETADIHFFVGGTQTNLTSIAAFLRPHEAVISVESGHVCVHETGAIEATGHKVVTMPGVDGKLTVADVESAVTNHSDEHMVKPKLVYISNSTEVGTIYTRSELVALRECCNRHNLYFYLDGARLGSALTSAANDLTLSDLGELLDAFYIGATKNGALFGEALIICNGALKSDFRYMIKQRGGLLAKGRLLGIQFLELFKDGLYFDLATHANEMACKLSKGIEEAGHGFLTESPSNQVFPILPKEIVEQLEEKYSFYRWQDIDGKIAIRLITSWATKEDMVEAFIEDVKTMS